MGLETGTYISSLVATNPVTGDAKTEGDDHLRLIKSTVLATFPNITGAVTPTQTEINRLGGIATKARVRVSMSIDQTGGTQLALDTEAFDSGSNFNTSTGIFTAPDTAAYLVQFFSWVTNTTGGAADFQLNLVHNVTAVATAPISLPDASGGNIAINGIYVLTAADTLKIVSGYTLTSSKIVRGGVATQLSIYQLL